MKQKIIKTSIAATLAMGIMAATPCPAQAIDAYYDTKHGGVALRDCDANNVWPPSQSCELVGRGYDDQHAQLHHAYEGQSIYGNPYWWQLSHFLKGNVYWRDAYAAAYYLKY